MNKGKLVMKQFRQDRSDIFSAIVSSDADRLAILMYGSLSALKRRRNARRGIALGTRRQGEWQAISEHFVPLALVRFSS